MKPTPPPASGPVPLDGAIPANAELEESMIETLVEIISEKDEACSGDEADGGGRARALRAIASKMMRALWMRVQLSRRKRSHYRQSCLTWGRLH